MSTSRPTSRRERCLVSLFLTVHVASLLALLPTAPRVSAAADPLGVLDLYRDLTATRVHWLPEPDTGEWDPTLTVIAHWRGRGGGAGRADTIRLDRGREARYPLLLQREDLRLRVDLGYSGWGDFYLPFFTGGLCRSLRSTGGGRPAVLELRTEWRRRRVPWREGASPAARVDDVGRYRCVTEEAIEQGGSIA